MKKSMVVLLYIMVSSGMIPAAAGGIDVVPKPRSVVPGRGYFMIRASGVAVRTAVEDPSSIGVAVGQLRDAFERKTGVRPAMESGSQAIVWLGIPGEDDAYRGQLERRKIWPDARIGEEGYVLHVGKDDILIAANTAAGVFYGVQTLKQILRGSEAADRIACMTVVDWPALRYRGVQDDISRGPVPTKAFMEAQIRRFAELKYNLYSCYVEHVVATKRHGDFAPAGGALTIDEWKALSEYAKTYQIEVMANFQSLGHFEKIMAYPQYRVYGETDRMISPVYPEGYRLLSDVYEEMAPAFSSPFFNVNCDETWDLGRGGSKPLVDSLGVARVYADHVRRLSTLVTGLGKRMMIWGDIVLDHPEILDLLPKETIMGAWTYGASDSFEDFFLPLKRAGFDFFFSPGVLNSGRMMPDFRMTRDNIRGFVRDASAHEALGMLNTVWDDGGKALFSLDWYGVAYGADHAWHPNEDGSEVFDRRFSRGVYGDPIGALPRAIDALNALTDLGPTHEMNEAVFWKTLVPDRGERLRLDMGTWDRILQISEEAVDLLAQDRSMMYAEDIPYFLFTARQYRFLAESRFAYLHASEKYKAACFEQTTNRPFARACIVESLDALGRIREDLLALRNAYRRLWLNENRLYALDHVLDKYDTRIEDLADAERLVVGALEDFDKGHYLPPPAEVRLAVEEAGGRYFQYWLLCGPFPNVGWKGRTVDYLAPAGGETGVRPFAGDAFESKDGVLHRWIKFDSPEQAGIDLFGLFEEKTEVLVYAYCRIESPVDQTVVARVGSNDGIEVVCNGERVHRNHVKRGLILDEDTVRLPLRQGANHILLKIDQNKGGWGFSFRLPDHDIRNHKHKYTIVR